MTEMMQKLLTTVTVTRVYPDGAALAACDVGTETTYIPCLAAKQQGGLEIGQRFDAILVPNTRSATVGLFARQLRKSVDHNRIARRIGEVEDVLLSGGVWTAEQLVAEVFGPDAGQAELAATAGAAEALYIARRVRKGILFDAGAASRVWYTAENATAIDLDVFEDDEAEAA